MANVECQPRSLHFSKKKTWLVWWIVCKEVRNNASCLWYHKVLFPLPCFVLIMRQFMLNRGSTLSSSLPEPSERSETSIPMSLGVALHRCILSKYVWTIGALLWILHLEHEIMFTLHVLVYCNLSVFCSQFEEIVWLLYERGEPNLV